MFERYVNFEFYKTSVFKQGYLVGFERYVNFEFYKTAVVFDFLLPRFERYVNFEFYKLLSNRRCVKHCLRDM